MNRLKRREPTKKKVITKKKKNNGKKFRRSWDKSSVQVESALVALDRKESYRKVSKEYSIPVGVLHRLKHNECSKKGPASILTAEEEQEIVSWILYRAAIGVPASVNELKDSVEHYIKKLNRSNPFKNGRPGRSWFDSFKKRHPNIVYRTAQSLETVRANVSEEDLRNWFQKITKYMQEKNLLDLSPSRIFNCDESSIQLNPKPSQVLAEKGAKTVYQCTEGSDKENHSVLFNYSANST